MTPAHFDLHAHSTASDGTLPPAAVVARARARGVDVFALTDHDTVDGIAPARAAAAECGLSFIAGIELSVSWEKHLVHVLGLCVDPLHGALQAGVQHLNRIRAERAKQMALKLEKHGIPDALQGARKFAPNAIVTRRHFAHYLAQIGKAPTVSAVFESYLRPGKPGYVATQWVSLEDAVGWIHDAGGIAVIAHPRRYDMTATTLRRLARQFVDCGGVGIEVVCGDGGHDAIQSSGALARRMGLLGSVGSDFHDVGNAWIDLGKLAPLPEDVTPVWTHERFQRELHHVR
jgi:hypothetical protein